MHVQLPNMIRVKGPAGAEVTVDVSNMKMDAAQKAAFRKLMEVGDPAKLAGGDLEKLKSLKAQIQGGDVNTFFIVRFDWKWVRID